MASEVTLRCAWLLLVGFELARCGYEGGASWILSRRVVGRVVRASTAHEDPVVRYITPSVTRSRGMEQTGTLEVPSSDDCEKVLEAARHRR